MNARIMYGIDLKYQNLICAAPQRIGRVEASAFQLCVSLQTAKSLDSSGTRESIETVRKRGWGGGETGRGG
jgi:hypothetical protein